MYQSVDQGFHLIRLGYRFLSPTYLCTLTRAIGFESGLYSVVKYQLLLLQHSHSFLFVRL